NNYATAHQWMNKRKWQVLGLAALAFSAGLVFFIIWTIEMIAAAAMSKGGVILTVFSVLGLVSAPFGIIASAAIVLLASFICFAVLACEENRFGAIISRGMTLTFGDFWRTLAFGLLLYTVVMAITVPLSLPLIVAHAFDMFRHGLANGSDYEGY